MKKIINLPQGGEAKYQGTTKSRAVRGGAADAAQEDGLEKARKNGGKNRKRMEVVYLVKTAIRRAEQMTEQVLSRHCTEEGRTCPESGGDAPVPGNGKRPEGGDAGKSMIQ